MRRQAWHFASALWLLGCGVPALDNTGAIRCGTDRTGGGCPAGYACTYGRCCPSSGPGAASCPAPETLAVDGSIKCTPGNAQTPGICPTNFECRFDRCCPTDRAGTGLCSPQRAGAACADDAACNTASTPAAERLVCVTAALGFPNGACIRGNRCVPTDPNACGSESVCVQGACYPRCIVPVGTTRVPCRADRNGDSALYTCRRISADDTTTEGVCLPDCGRTAENLAMVCAMGESCERSSGFCTASCMSRADCENAGYECGESSRTCERHFLHCATDDECNEGSITPTMQPFACRAHPQWTGPAERGKVCVLNRSAACVPGTACRESVTINGTIVRFPCIDGECVVRLDAE